MLVNSSTRTAVSALVSATSVVAVSDGITSKSAAVTSGPVEGAKSSGFGSLLAPTTAGNLLNLITEMPSSDNSAKSLTPRQWLAHSMTLAANSPEELPQARQPNYYSQADLDTIKAVTGYNLVVMNGATAVVDDQGNLPSPDIAKKVSLLAATIEGNRAAGAFTGEVTLAYLDDVFAQFTAAKEPLPSEWLDNALHYLQGTNGPSNAA
ncbi:hypothetical protein WBP07_08910 [Novosphingobium sp. BL-8A]|uniref:hypothetical protein n=1 Tax=Novosphingobium sp. BL-8A TaxID=3127639 RepID=UPI003756D5FD